MTQSNPDTPEGARPSGRAGGEESLPARAAELHALRGDVLRLADQLDQLRRRLGRLEAQQIAETAAAAPRPPRVEAGRERAATASPALPPTTAAPKPEPPPRAVPSRPAAKPPVVSQPLLGVEWEAVIGGSWLNRIGVAILLLAIAFFAHYAWQRKIVPPAVQVALLYLLGGAALGVGEYFYRRRLPVFAQGFTALGIFSLYGAGFVAHHIHHLFPVEVTFWVYLITTAVAMLLAVRSNSVAVVLLGVLGGYLTPIIVSTGEDREVALFTYLACLNAGILGAATWRRWDFLKPIAWAATALMFLSWAAEYYAEPKAWVTEWMLSLHAAVFLVGVLVPAVALKRKSTAWDIAVSCVNSLTYFGATWLMFRLTPGHWLGEFAEGMAVGHAVLAGLAFQRVTGKKPWQLLGEITPDADRLPRYLLALAAVFLTLAIPIHLSADIIGIAWLAQGAAFSFIGLHFGDRQAKRAAQIVFVLGGIRLVAHEVLAAVSPGVYAAVDLRFLLVAIGSGLLFVAAALYRYLPRDRAGLAADYDVILRLPKVQISWGQWWQPVVRDRHLPFTLSMVGDALVLAAAGHQWDGARLTLVFVLNALVVSAFAWRIQSEPLRIATLIAYGVAFLRWAGYDATLQADPAAMLDRRFLVALVLGGCGAVSSYWIRPRREGERPLWMILALGAYLLVLGSASFQFREDGLAVFWAGAGLAVAAASRWKQSYELAVLSGVTFAAAFLRWAQHSALVGDPGGFLHASIDVRFAAALAVVACGWLSAWLMPRASKPIASMWGAEVTGLPMPLPLALAANLVLIGGIACQWDNHAVLALWTLDIAALWFVGFRNDDFAVRATALCLSVALVAPHILLYDLAVPGPAEDFRLILNPRLGSLGLVSALLFLAAGRYVRSQQTERIVGAGPTSGAETPEGAEHPAPSAPESPGAKRDGLARWLMADFSPRPQERSLDVALVIAGNVLVLTALTLEVSGWFDRAEARQAALLANLTMGRQAAYSVLWAVYAAAMILVGFAIRYRPLRLLAMGGLGLLLLKVFLVDLQDLQLLYRVVCFAVVGAALVGISFLYQRYKDRLLAPLSAGKEIKPDAATGNRPTP